MSREIVVLGAAVLALSCGPGQVEQVQDFTEEVERICTDYCELVLACREPPWFETQEECEHVCLHSAYIYNDTVCGDVIRGELACVASQPTCELYNDTLNVHAEDHMCKAEMDRWHEVYEYCGQSAEDPYPKGRP